MLYAAVQYVPGLDYGVGVDTPSGGPCNVAVTGEQTGVPGATGGLVDFSLTRVDSFDDFTSKLGISADASGGFGLFSASAKLDYAKECHIQSNSLFMLVMVKVTQAAMSIKIPRIVPEADALLANGKMDEFRQRYGDMFVRGLITGGQFYGLIEIETESEEQRENFATEIDASYGGFFDASFKYDKDEARKQGMESAKVHCHIEGGNINRIVPTTVDAMLDRARNFPSEIAGNAIPYVALLNNYSIVPTSSPPNFIDLQQQKDVLARCAERRNTILQLLNDIEFIMTHGNQFEDAGKGQLSKWSSDLNHDLKTIALAASTAVNNPRDAQFPAEADFLVQLPLTLPQRKAPRIFSVPQRLPRPIMLAPGLRQLIQQHQELEPTEPTASASTQPAPVSAASTPPISDTSRLRVGPIRPR